MTRGNVWVVFGARGEGKTEFALHTMRQTRPVIFVDPAKDAVLDGAYLVSQGNHDVRDLLRVLRRGRSLVLRTTAAGASDTVTAACRLAAETHAGVWVDEAHLVHSKGHEHPLLVECITAARHLRVDVGLVTQAPQALSSHALHAGCTVVVFRLPFAGPWLSSYGLPRDLPDRLTASPPHSFFRLVGARLTGPHRLRVPPSRGSMQILEGRR